MKCMILQHGNTPLILACEGGSLIGADLLLKKGANASVINKVSYIYGYTIYQILL